MSNAITSRVSISTLAAKKKEGQKWAMLTCYEQMTATIFDLAGIPVLLVGDSAGNNFLGEENTIPVTVDELIPLARAVVKSSNNAMVVGDLPFGSYESSPEQALATGIRFFKEDIWQEGGPVAELAKRNIGLFLVPNGSPFEANKDDVRLALVQRRAKQINAPLAYVNMAGGQDDLVFDGDTIVVDSDGSVIARAPQFEEGLMVIDLDVKLASSDPDLIISEPPILKYKKLIHGVAPRLDDLAEIWQALVVGLRDYVIKNKFPSVVLGLSGGIDSAVVAAIAVDAIGADRVHGIALPSKYSSDHSLSDAKQLAINTGVKYRIIEIEPMVQSFISNLGLSGLAEENVQARVRGTTLMGLSNQEGHLVLATGNKSELAVGYSTLYGDAVGGYAPIKDLYKTQVWALANWRNEIAKKNGQTPPIPANSIIKEPSAELRPGQKDSDSLPDYKVLDQLLHIYIDQDGGRPGAIAAGFDAALVDRVVQLVDRAEYKRRQYPPGTKISGKAFGKDRRLPITSHWKES